GWCGAESSHKRRTERAPKESPRSAVDVDIRKYRALFASIALPGRNRIEALRHVFSARAMALTGRAAGNDRSRKEQISNSAMEASMTRKVLAFGLGVLTATAVLWSGVAPADAQQGQQMQQAPQMQQASQMEQAQQAQQPQQAQRPNILFIMGDDIGWMQPSIYHRGLMVGETPNIDRIGQEGAIFMDYVAMQSCTSGRNAFFTGMY